MKGEGVIWFQAAGLIREKYRRLLIAAFAAAGVGTIFHVDPRIFFLLPGLIVLIPLFRRPAWIIYPLAVFSCLRLDAWLSSWLSFPFGKVIFLTLLVALVLALLLTRTRFNPPTAAVMLYLFFLASSFSIGLLGATRQGVVLWLEDYMYAAGFFLTFFLFINRWERLEKIIYLMVFMGAAVSLVNIGELIDPAGFMLSHSAGRAAGFLKNANTSAFIVNLSLIAAIYALRAARSRRFTLVWVMAQIVFAIGVLATFSREGLLLFGLIFLSQFFIIRRKSRRLLVLLLAGVILILATARTVRFIERDAVGDVRYSFSKVLTLARGQVDDNDRWWLLQFHLRRFAEHPLTGQGLYSALLYSIPSAGLSGSAAPSGPHNTFALILSETGIIPLLVYLAFLLALLGNITAARRAEGNAKESALGDCLIMLFAAFLIHHFFSHMMLLSRFSMLLMALFALPLRTFSPREERDRIVTGRREPSRS
ncbi:MAG: O-antigen ligase family protein [Candidatus Krumholzibacteriota bacterium]|nr:O-antigen ligase family protein [Candidatus Krumholzibacteriota bacterium]